MKEPIEIIFLDDDNMTVLDRKFVDYGEKAEYTGEIPEKPATIDGTYEFIGWTNEEKLECVTEKIVLVAKYKLKFNAKTEEAMYEASLQNAQNSNIKETIEAGKKVSEQQIALSKDPRSYEEIVKDILENGKTAIGAEIDKKKDAFEK